jgi:diadenosine tetraphosphate (Ap4A) HIT family hydrolase/ADP-ribose pyrophosphatase YjhB (NUDIX family)
MGVVLGCSFCSGEQREPQTLTETKHFSLLADRQPLRRGHLLIVPREHVPCLAALPPEWDKELAGLRTEAEEFLTELHGPSIVYERCDDRNLPIARLPGQRSSSDRPSGPERHAHLHLVPSELSVRPGLLPDYGGQATAWPTGVREWYTAHGSYLYYHDAEGSLVVPADATPPGHFHDLVRGLAREERLIEDGDAAARRMRPEWAQYRRRFGDSASEVVACFLRKEGRVCLLKRSERLDSAPGRWHIVAGYLPRGAEPLEHALTEVAEETGLHHTQVQLLSAGGAITIGDPFRGMQWRIFPFLFEVLQGEPQLNWEHDAFVWVDPTEISSYGTMHWLPQVYHSLEATTRR